MVHRHAVQRAQRDEFQFAIKDRLLRGWLADTSLAGLAGFRFSPRDSRLIGKHVPGEKHEGHDQ